MPHVRLALFAILGLLVCANNVHGQAIEPSASVPRLINVSGTFRPSDGRPPAPVKTVRLALYSEPTGGSVLWEETQTIQIGSQGQYNVLLGLTQRDGLPLDVFGSGDARCLGNVLGKRRRS